MRKLQNIAIFGIIAAILSVSVAVAVPTGATVSEGTQETYTPSAESVTTEGGNVTQVNITGVTITNKWAGFWGEVSGYIVLADSSGKNFYNWTISDPTGAVVYAANDTISDWGCTNILPVEGPSDSFLPSFLIEGTDSYNNTFTSSEDVQIPLSCSARRINVTYTWQGGIQGSDFPTYALKAVSEGALIWAGKVKADQTSFKGTPTADYQILAGVNSETGTTTFYFYLELA